MQLLQCLLFILESGNKFLNNLQYPKGRLCSTRKPEKSSLAFPTFWSKFAIAELAPKLVTFLCRCAAYPYPLCCERPCVYWHHLFLHVQHWNRFHTLQKTKPTFLEFPNEFEFITLLHHESLNFTQYLFFFDGTSSELSGISFAMFWSFHDTNFIC